MERVDYESVVIQDIINWDKREELNLTPWYQRRSIWTPPQKSYLINTIFSGKPVPSVYVRHTLDLQREKSVKEVVDGQQRIRAVLEFRNNEYVFRHPVSGKRQKYGDLTRSDQELFLMAKLSVAYLVGSTDGDVIDIFGRINSVSKTLNDQEKRNSAFSGEFKQFCLIESSKRVELFKRLELFTATEISRMLEVRFMSELALNLLEGLSDGSAGAINSIYRKYDEKFDRWSSLEGRFDRIFNLIGSVPNIQIKDTLFKRQPLFFSLCRVIDGTRHVNPSKLGHVISRIDELHSSGQLANSTKAGERNFLLSIKSSTQRISQRREREKFIASFF